MTRRAPRLRPPPQHELPEQTLSVAQCVQRVLACFAIADRVEFASLFSTRTGRADVIVTFLALLELIRMRVVRARQEERFGPIVLELAVASLDEAASRVQDLGSIEEWRGGGVSDGHGVAGDR